MTKQCVNYDNFLPDDVGVSLLFSRVKMRFVAVAALLDDRE